MITCIPQIGKCPNDCQDCFFQSGRSYLEPLEKNLPNIPGIEEARGRVVWVNDGNDSNVFRGVVIERTKDFEMKFYNTSIPHDLESFPGPVVLTVNPGVATDIGAHYLKDIPKNLMFVRARTNTWNLKLIDKIVTYYSGREVPIILTFMAYHSEESIPEEHRLNYTLRVRTSNSYHAITTDAWRRVMERYQENKWVYSCGKIEGEWGNTSCRFCGNCIREYFVTMERMR